MTPWSSPYYLTITITPLTTAYCPSSFLQTAFPGQIALLFLWSAFITLIKNIGNLFETPLYEFNCQSLRSADQKRFRIKLCCFPASSSTLSGSANHSRNGWHQPRYVLPEPLLSHIWHLCCIVSSCLWNWKWYCFIYLTCFLRNPYTYFREGCKKITELLGERSPNTSR